MIVVSYRTPEDVRDCFAKLTHSTHTDFAVHVCENGGQEAFGALVLEVSRVAAADDAVTPSLATDAHCLASWTGRLPSGQPVHLYCADNNLGFAGGVNFCIARVSADEGWQALWVLNPDTEPDDGALAALVAHAHSDTAYGIVGSRLVSKATNRVQLYGGRWRPWMASGLNIGQNAPANAKPDVAEVEYVMTYVNGASMLVTRRYIESVGLMRDDYFLYNEEVDWCFRRGVFKLGYAHDSLVYHAHGSSIGSDRNRKARSRLSVYLDERNKLVFSRRFYRSRYPAIVVSALLMLTIQYLRAGAFANFVNAIEGWFAGVRGETGKPLWMR